MHQLQELHIMITRVVNKKAVFNHNGQSNGYLFKIFFVIYQCTDVAFGSEKLVIRVFETDSQKQNPIIIKPTQTHIDRLPAS